jgi:hypothetical protein
MTFKCLAVALAGLLVLLILAAGNAADPQLLVQTKTIALDPLADQHRGGMKWSHGAFLFQSGGEQGSLPPSTHWIGRAAWFLR